MNVLVVNAGSSSLKLGLLEESGEVLSSRHLSGYPGGLAQEEVADAVEQMIGEAGGGGVQAVGHRVVHGGSVFTAAVRIDGELRAGIERLTELAPLHQPAALAGIDAVAKALPEVPTVACFDTAFHATMPDAASTYAVPAQWREEWAVRRYGFHGLSYAYATRRTAEMLGRQTASPDRPGEALRVVVCHLGAGASLCAARGERSVETTMGFTPLEGLVMATRSGTVDPALVGWLQQHRGLSAEQVSDALEHRSGLLGIAGTADMREVVERMNSGDPLARLAFDVYLHRLRAAIAAMTAALGGLDALVFTGGVGEHAPAVRSGAATGLEYLGVALNHGLNAAAGGDANISAERAPVQTLVVTAREDMQIARETRAVLDTG
jgi:acetate kinase